MDFWLGVESHTWGNEQCMHTHTHAHALRVNWSLVLGRHNLCSAAETNAIFITSNGSMVPKWSKLDALQEAQKWAKGVWRVSAQPAGKLWKYTRASPRALRSTDACELWLPTDCQARSGYQEGSSPNAKIWNWVLKLIQNKLPFIFPSVCQTATLMTTLALPAVARHRCGIEGTPQL